MSPPPPYAFSFRCERTAYAHAPFKKSKARLSRWSAHRDKYRFYRSRPLLCLWALLRPGHGTIRLQWQPLFISPSYWNKWQARQRLQSFCKISAVHSIFLYSFLLSLSLFSPTRRRSPILSPSIALHFCHTNILLFCLFLSLAVALLHFLLSRSISHAHTHVHTHAHSFRLLYSCCYCCGAYLFWQFNLFLCVETIRSVLQ